MDSALQLRESVREAYSQTGSNPAGWYPFPVGEDFAVGLGYPPELLAKIPRASIESFTGVSNVSIFADIPPGAKVLDLGCGSGLDALIAALRVDSQGAVVGIDFAETMLKRAAASRRARSLANLIFVLV